MNKEVVIAAYKRADRNYDWIKDLDPSIKVTVYRKGNEADLKENEIYLKNNVGRDIHTFFTHLINRYDSLADYTYFTQDYFADHVPNYVDIMNGDINTLNSNAVIAGKGWWCLHVVPYIGNFSYRDNTDGFFCEVQKIYETLFYEPCPEVIQWVPAAASHYVISKEKVREIPLYFLKKAVYLLEKAHMSPWAFEILHTLILSRKNFGSSYSL